MYITDCGILHKILWTQPAPIEIPESMKIKGKWQDSTEYKESNLNIKKWTSLKIENIIFW